MASSRARVLRWLLAPSLLVRELREPALDHWRAPRALNGQDGAKDEFCVRLTSTWLIHDAYVGVKCKWKRG
jgi:hypothetical protein